MKTKLSPDQEHQICESYITPAPTGEYIGANTLARAWGVVPQTIRNILARYGVKTRDSKQSHSGGKRCKPVKNTPVGNPPLCKCGCKSPVKWNQRKNQWNLYFDGHYRPDAKYKNPRWLRVEYLDKFRTMSDIATECGVHPTTIKKFMNRFGINARPQSESLVLSGGVRGKNNPAWKGGVADWDYSHDWKAICKSVKDRDRWTCQQCKERRQKWGSHLHVHHKDGNKLNNTPSNLISLCAKCHRQVHAGKAKLS